MKKIIAIGGGEIGRAGFPVETTKIDKEIIRLTGKKYPRFLFIPTASSDSEVYVNDIKKHFGGKLGCKVSTLNLTKKRKAKKEIEKRVFSSDIIYVGGGNTLYMMNIWKKTGLDKILKSAYEKNIILSGLSAGSICWFKYGHSDSRKFKDKRAPYIKVSGLGLIDALHCPHYHSERNRRSSLKEMMKKNSGVAIALDNCSAIEVINDEFRILRSKQTANAYKVFWHKGKYHEEKLLVLKKMSPLAQLLAKKI